MRFVLSALVVLGAIAAAQPASAQTYGAYPVCMQIYGPLNYYECGYTSIAQCQASAAGRAAQCVLNPYLAQAPLPARRIRRAY